ncbi:hypothetical protein Vadar_006182 [Vaccinium darrowii]|uniref:Uncharacterized protein n=1 Tax=Vaccinium darrowii TaxID=229202 RepID=A0ACB7YBX7_9ERIC|nr:hypothetical protein Vadar_006182 [Vaccinium darrowii]
MSETSGLRRHIVEKLKHLLDAHNPFVQNFRQMAQSPDIQNYELIIKEQPVDRRQYDLPTASQVAAIIVGGDEAALIKGRDIAIQPFGGNLRYIQDIVGFYDPMQYPFLLPYGTYGWDVNSHNDSGTKLTCRDFYAYRLQIRPNDQSLLLRGGRLLQQYVVDNYVKIESQKLRWMRSHQNQIRSDLYDGLQDSVHMGIINAGVRDLWDDFYLFMIEDYPSSASTNNSYLINRLLRDLNDLLSQHNRTIADFDLPYFTMSYLLQFRSKMWIRLLH